MSLVSLQRRGPGNAEELVVDDDGAFRLWRSFAASRIGSFTGVLDAPATAELAEDVRAAVADPPPAPTRRPTGALELVGAGSVSAAFGAHDPPDGTWGPLRRRLRALLDELTAHPAAALEVEVDDDARALRVRALGDEHAASTLAGCAVQVDVYDADGAHARTWEHADPGGIPDALADTGEAEVPLLDGVPLEDGGTAIVRLRGMLTAAGRTEEVEVAVTVGAGFG